MNEKLRQLLEEFDGTSSDVAFCELMTKLEELLEQSEADEI